MHDFWKSDRVRSFALKAAGLGVVWLLLVTAFAAQFYWLGQDWPLPLPWREAFLRAVTEWWPWLLLAPLVMGLAEWCRLDRSRRFWGVWPHLPACLLVALAYQGLSLLFTEQPTGVFFRSSAGDVGIIQNGVGEVRGFAAGGHPPTLPPPGAMVTSVTDAAGPKEIRHEAGSGRVSVQVMRTGIGDAPPGPGPFAAAFTGGFPPPLPGPWTRFFQLAATRAQSTIPIYWAIVCVTWVASYYQQLRERERRALELEARLTQANLQTLKAQLQPHFLFNTLNAIASLVRRRPEAAEEMIGSLSDFLRMNLDTAQQHEVPLRREIEFLDHYLDIQQIRFGERLRVRKEITPAALDVPVPTLILQPLVENSVRHGIEAREQGGLIVIRAQRAGDRLRLEVCDDGEGLRGGQLAALREGLGLSNTKTRLQELYGDDHRFQITANAGGGLTVTVELPGTARPVAATLPGGGC